MSERYPGGIISKTPVTPSGPYSNDTASGIWTLDQQAYWQKLGQWPTAGNNPVDPQFNYVTMLLHGDGTNGAQNNTFLDSGPNTFTITRNGNTTQGSFSPYGDNWSNYFDGTGDYLTVPDNAVFSLGSGNFTIEAWVNPTASPNQPMIIGQWTSSYAWTMQLSNDGNRNLRALLHDGSFQDYVSTSPLGLNTWNHCALVRESNTVSLYLNGARVYTTTFSGTVTNSTSAVSVGADASGGQPLQGYISNARVVVGTALYSGATYTVPTTPLTAISGTSLLTCQSNRFFDSSSTALAVTAFGNTSVERFNPFGTSTAYSTSVIGGSGYFDGSGDYLNATSASLSGQFTIEYWYYSTTSSTNYGVTFGDSSTSTGIELYQSGTTFYLYSNNGFRITGGTVNPNSWNHVALTRDGSNVMRLYVNGVVSGTTYTSSANFSTTMRLGVEFYSGSISGYLTGYVCDFRMLSATSTPTIPTSPLTAISGTTMLLNFTNGAIFDNAMMNDLETVGNAQISTSVVKYGTGSVYFDGTGDYLQFPYSPSYNFGTGEFTIEMWLYVPTGYFQTIQRLVTTARYDSPQNSCYFSLGNDNGIGAGYLCAAVNLQSPYTTGNPLLSSSTLFPVATWTHVALVRSGSTVTIYQGGTSVASITNTAAWNFGGPYGLRISGTGWAPTTENLQGYIDDLRITAGYARYTANFTPPTAAFFNYGPT